jgi:hypothetical protein
MAVINFPDSPSDGATQTVGGITYTYSSSKGYWTSTASSGGGGGGGASVTTDDTAPSSPSDGDLWYDTDDGGMFVYYEDTDSSQWVEVIGSQGSPGADGADGAAGADGGAGVASVYATIDLLPLSGNTQGDMAHVTANNTLYFWNGSGWYKIALINTNPSISGVASSYDLATDGTATTVTITASDPEGLPITYSIASDTSGNIATVAQGTGASTNVFTITPTTNIANGGTFSLTFRASDGVNVATAPATFTLQFQVANSNYTTALITTAGSAGTNSTFTDSSSNSHSITANGNTTQASFSPYRSGGYSTYFDGSGDYISMPYDSSFDLIADFTIEFWFNPSDSTIGGITQNGATSFVGNAFTIVWDHGTYADKISVWERNNSNSGTTALLVSSTLSTNEWHHVAVTRSGSTATLWINGVSAATATDSNTWYIGETNLIIGKYWGADFTGYIRDFRVVKGTAVYTAAFTPPTESLTAITNTSLLACHLPYIADGSTNNHTITPNGNVSTKAFAPYDYQEYVVGDHGGSLYLDGSGDYLTIANDASLKPTGDFTAEGWCYVDGTNASGSIFNMWTSSQGRMWALYVSSGGVTLSGNGSNLISHTINNLNKWVHVAFTRDNSNALCTLYVNGKSVGTSNTTFSNSSAALAIGFNLDNAPASYYYNGSISDLRISNAVRYSSDFTPPAEPFTTDSNTGLLINGQDAKIFDKSQSIQSLTLAGNTTASTAQYKYLPTSMYFDGIGDYINLNEAVIPTDASTDWTIEFWFNVPSSSTRYDFICQYAASVAGRTTINSTTSGEIMFFQNGLSVAPLTSTDTFTANTWNHVAVVNNGQTRTLYLNGVSQGTATGTSSMQDANTVIGALTSNPISNYLEGYIEDLRITKGLARYTANFTPPTAALQG